jgi:hypothetical protein
MFHSGNQLDEQKVELQIRHLLDEGQPNAGLQAAKNVTIFGIASYPSSPEQPNAHKNWFLLSKTISNTIHR